MERRQANKIGPNLNFLVVKNGYQLLYEKTQKQDTSKGKCVREASFFANIFPSLGNFVNKKVGFRRN